MASPKLTAWNPANKQQQEPPISPHPGLPPGPFLAQLELAFILHGGAGEGKTLQWDGTQANCLCVCCNVLCIKSSVK